jgi:hypothetical protein
LASLGRADLGAAASRLRRAHALRRVRAAVSASTANLWKLLLACDLLALVPLTLARPLLDTGELAKLRVSTSLQMEPIGILQPTAGMGEAATRLGMHLAG